MTDFTKYLGAAWRRPPAKMLEQEYNVEYLKHAQSPTFDPYPELQGFMDAANSAPSMPITPDLSIAGRTHTDSQDALLGLISGYASYPKYRNEDTLQALFDRIAAGEPTDMPMIFQDPEGAMRILSGNTRLNVADQVGVTPEALMLPVDKLWESGLPLVPGTDVTSEGENESGPRVRPDANLEKAAEDLGQIWENIKAFPTEGWPAQMVKGAWNAAQVPGQLVTGEKSFPIGGEALSDPEFIDTLSGFMDMISPSALAAKPRPGVLGVNLPGGKSTVPPTSEIMQLIDSLAPNMASNVKLNLGQLPLTYDEFALMAEYMAKPAEASHDLFKSVLDIKKGLGYGTAGASFMKYIYHPRADAKTKVEAYKAGKTQADLIVDDIDAAIKQALTEKLEQVKKPDPFKQEQLYTGDVELDKKLAAFAEKYPKWEDYNNLTNAKWASAFKEATDIFPESMSPATDIFALIDPPQKFGAKVGDPVPAGKKVDKFVGDPEAAKPAKPEDWIYIGNAETDKDVNYILNKYAGPKDAIMAHGDDWEKAYKAGKKLFPEAHNPITKLYEVYKPDSVKLPTMFDKFMQLKSEGVVGPDFNVGGFLNDMPAGTAKKVYDMWTGPSEKAIPLLTELDSIANSLGYPEGFYKMIGDYSTTKPPGAGTPIWVAGYPTSHEKLQAVWQDMLDNPVWKRVLKEKPLLADPAAREAARLAGGYTEEAFRGTGYPSRGELHSKYATPSGPEYYFAAGPNGPEGALAYGPNLAGYYYNPKGIENIDYPKLFDLYYGQQKQGWKSYDDMLTALAGVDHTYSTEKVWDPAVFNTVNELGKRAGRPGTRFMNVDDSGGVYDQLVMYDMTKIKNRLAAAFDPTSPDPTWMSGLPLGLLEGFLDQKKPMTKEQWNAYTTGGGA